MRVCYFGNYNGNISRNKILINGLRINNVTVIECNSRLKGCVKYIDMIKKHRCLIGKYDVMIVGFPGFQSMILAKFLTRKPIIFDAFLSIYDSMVFDRKQIKKNSPKSFYFWFLDWLSMSLANIVLFDTNEHINYASREFHIAKSRFRRIFVGSSTDIFSPKNMLVKDKFRVFFYGTYIPLHGIEYIVMAAKILEKEKDLEFVLLGSGQTKNEIIELSKKSDSKNIIFLDRVSPERLSEEISKSDICLGIFGNTEKTKRVIPNKVYECAAMRKPIITADTKAIRELFDEEELFLVETANPDLIADAIIELKNNKKLSEKIANRAYKKFTENVTPIILGAELKKIIINYE